MKPWNACWPLVMPLWRVTGDFGPRRSRRQATTRRWGEAIAADRPVGTDADGYRAMLMHASYHAHSTRE